MGGVALYHVDRRSFLPSDYFYYIQFGENFKYYFSDTVALKRAGIRCRSEP
jgi:hypothetical protein